MELDTELDKYRLKAYVSETSGNLPSEMFCYQDFPTVPFWEEEGDTPEDIFVNVASLADIQKYDVVNTDGSAPDSGEPFYRKHYIDLCSDSEASLEETWTKVKHFLLQTCIEIARLNGDTLPREVQELSIQP